MSENYEFLSGMKRTALCSEFSKADIGKTVTVMGWVDAARNLGSLIFIRLRDRSGCVQIFFDQDMVDYEKATTLRHEFVIAVTGQIVARDEENVNAEMKTGEIEIKADVLKILSKSETPPFAVTEQSNVREELRLKYRYLDLRRAPMQRNLMLRSEISMSARNYLAENGFLEIETPMLIKSTPEGARDYLVPSRVHTGNFYALPQSPQIFKQLLMVSGYDRYFQIVKCFRDEDLRADRQPEFTQIDMEMSFVEQDDVMAINEGLMKRIFKDVLDVDVQLPVKRITYADAMNRYGSDKPDTRFGLELKDISHVVKSCEFKVFSSVCESGGSVRAICVSASIPRKQIDAYGEFVKTYGAKGLAWINLKEEGITSPIAKFLSKKELADIIETVGAKTGDVIFIVADKDKVVFDSLGALRLKVAKALGLIDENVFDFLWVTDFPLFEYDEENDRYVAMHHPFTSPHDEDIEFLESQPEKVRAKAYDMVLNGNEIGGGSVRIHSTDLQERMLKVLGFTQERAWEQFGYLMEALKYGTPPHGGLAYGLDRLAMIMTKSGTIRDVIAFPKVQNASCLMSNAPGTVEQSQLEELGIDIVEE